MLDFFSSKTKVHAWGIQEIPIESLQIIGIGQINPYCDVRYDNEMFLTVVNIANESNKFDEKEGLILAKYFTVKKCPKCKRTALIPASMRINMDATYKLHEEEIAYNAFEEHPSRRHFPSAVEAFCNHCSTCFDIRIQSKDTWVKEARKIKEKNLITSSWDEYNLD